MRINQRQSVKHLLTCIFVNRRRHVHVRNPRQHIFLNSNRSNRTPPLPNTNLRNPIPTPTDPIRVKTRLSPSHSEGKFFSNGLDLAWAQSNGPSEFPERLHQMVTECKALIADLISLPLPTIAAVNGHAAAAGFMVAIGHDYVLMKKDKGVIYMSELDIGLSYPDNIMDFMRAKLGSSKSLRNVVLQGMKIKGEEAVKMGIIDSAHDSREETVEAAMRLGEKLGWRKWNGEVYCEIRKSTFKDMLPLLGLVEKEVLAAKL